MISLLSKIQHIFIPLAYIEWNPDPVLLSLGPIEIRWYGLMYALAIMLGYLIALAAYRKENLSPNHIVTFILYQFACAFLGARLWTVIFYEWSYFSAQPIEILKVWKGGLSSHGAVIGIFVSVWLYGRKYSRPKFWWSLDVLAIIGSITAGLIRIGNLFNSEILGIESSAPWSFIFESVDSIPRHPVVLYESLSYFILALVLWILWNNGLRKKPGFITAIFLCSIFPIRILLETFKENAEYTQILSIPFIIFGAILIYRLSSKNKKSIF